MAHGARSGGGTGRVLIADDEDYVRAALKMILKSQGYEVVEAVDGEDAVRKYLAAPEMFDVLLLDLDMPRLTGEEAFRQIITQHHHAKVILLSGGIRPPTHCKGAAYLQKPFENRELIGMVRDILGSSHR